MRPHFEASDNQPTSRSHRSRHLLVVGIGTVVVFTAGVATGFVLRRSDDPPASSAPSTAAERPPASLAPSTGAEGPPASLAPSTAAEGLTPSAAPGGFEVLRALFPIGVDFQPVDSFSGWQALGINTLIRTPNSDDVNTWADAADAAGLYQIRQPREPATADIGNPWLLAWSHRDEPDSVEAQIPSEELAAQYDEWKEIDPARPVFINVMGGMDQHDVDTEEDGPSWYRKYLETADLVSADRYPVNRDRPLTEVGDALDELQRLASPRPIFAYIEASDFDTTSDAGAPTADQLRGLVWHAIIHGARGIFYFPVRVKPSFVADAAPPEVKEAMPALHRQITGLQDVLQGPIDPSSMSVEVTEPLEAAWRTAQSGNFVIVLNMSDQPRSRQRIAIEGIGPAPAAEVYAEARSVSIIDGVITDDFLPYQVHIYRIP